MKKNIHIFIIISCLFLILFSYNNCEGGKTSNEKTATINTTPTTINPSIAPGNIPAQVGSLSQNIEFPSFDVDIEYTSSEEETSFFFRNDC